MNAPDDIGVAAMLLGRLMRALSGCVRPNFFDGISAWNTFDRDKPEAMCKILGLGALRVAPGGGPEGGTTD